MTQEWIERILVEFNVKLQDAQVYAFLNQHDYRSAKEIAEQLKMNRRQVYRSLKKLGQDNFIIRLPLVPAQFSAVGFDKVLNMLKAMSIEGTKDLERKKTELLEFWKSNL